MPFLAAAANRAGEKTLSPCESVTAFADATRRSRDKAGLVSMFFPKGRGAGGFFLQ
jgi:hypothetical protein